MTSACLQCFPTRELGISGSLMVGILTELPYVFYALRQEFWKVELAQGHFNQLRLVMISWTRMVLEQGLSSLVYISFPENCADSAGLVFCG